MEKFSFGLLVLLFLLGAPSAASGINSTVLLQWENVSNAVQRGALCNDFSTAGYFIRRNAQSSKWVIFLEGGGACSTPQSCNERFIEQNIRERYTFLTENDSSYVDVQRAWMEHKPSEVTSKLMTSLWKFSNVSSGSVWGIEGKDILSTEENENPTFHSHNHVLIPYCSSDLWLKQSKNFMKANQTGFQFQFDPTITQKHQFTFRGATILQAVFSDLFELHSLDQAMEVVFAGSSAGGIGVMNHARWLKKELANKAVPGCKLFNLLDSSWFIDYKGGVSTRLGADEIEKLAQSGEIIETCAVGKASCLIASSFLSNPLLYPQDIPTLVILSRYDLYLLVGALQSTPTREEIAIVRVVSEYGGSMSASLSSSVARAPELSFVSTSCFQHVYLATSDLWGEGGLLGSAGADGALKNNRFEHKVASGVWHSYLLQHFNTNSSSLQQLSLAQAVTNWLEAARNGDTVRYSDHCSGPHCNELCPETIVLGELLPYWGGYVQYGILGAVLVVLVTCIAVKAFLSLRAKFVSYEQRQFLERNVYGLFDSSESALPYCPDSEAISVACLNLRYSISLSGAALRSASSPTQRKRLLSMAACQSSSLERGGANDRGRRGRGDCEAAHAELLQEIDLSDGIRQFQELMKKKHSEKREGGEGCCGAVRLGRGGGGRRSERKEILKGISTYFNPGELVAILGPSGSGKTTFLDLLAGRRSGENYTGDIYVNGVPMEEIKDWYIANTGYVLQLATPYYEELTVRENLTLAAKLRLPSSLSSSQLFERVERVMRETGLTGLAGTTVGGCTGQGLSGGQKRRLCVALQLLSVPSLLFLDEPTSGLDATSSLELLSHLRLVASSNRTVVITIHQPRLEIFHMFDKIVMLCQGAVAYHGVPEKAYEVFLEANLSAAAASTPGRARGVKANEMESKNPADMIMDMLGCEEARRSILSYYQRSSEPRAVATAISLARQEGGRGGGASLSSTHKAGLLDRLTALEARASLRSSLSHLSYLPVVFLAYSVLLGTVYLQSDQPAFVLSGFGVFSCASALFMFPALQLSLHRAMEVFSLEYADGVGSPADLVLQTFLRFSALTSLPVLVSTAALYLLVTPYPHYDAYVLLEVTVVHFTLNHTWTALLLFVLAAQPSHAHRISPAVSAVSGFAGGFFVPPNLMPVWYKWLFHVNPNYYGFSAMIRLLLQGRGSGSCDLPSALECYPSSAEYVLTYFDLQAVNPFFHICVLMSMTVIFLLLACLSLWLRHSTLLPQLKKLLLKRSQRSAQPAVTMDTTAPVHMHNLLEGPGAWHDAPSIGSQASSSVSHHHLMAKDDEFKKITVQKHNLSSLLFRCQNASQSTVSVEPFTDTPRGRSNSARLGEGLLTSSSSAAEGNNWHRQRNTLSYLLRDGEEHTVWRPGSSKKTKLSSSSNGSLIERKQSILKRISTYRSLASQSELFSPTVGVCSTDAQPESGEGRRGEGRGRRCARPGATLSKESVERRLRQWREIESEALRLNAVESTTRNEVFSIIGMEGEINTSVVCQADLSPSPNEEGPPPPFPHHSNSTSLHRFSSYQSLPQTLDSPTAHSNASPPSLNTAIYANASPLPNSSGSFTSKQPYPPNFSFTPFPINGGKQIGQTFVFPDFPIEESLSPLLNPGESVQKMDVPMDTILEEDNNSERSSTVSRASSEDWTGRFRMIPEINVALSSSSESLQAAKTEVSLEARTRAKLDENPKSLSEPNLGNIKGFDQASFQGFSIAVSQLCESTAIQASDNAKPNSNFDNNQERKSLQKDDFTERLNDVGWNGDDDDITELYFTRNTMETEQSKLGTARLLNDNEAGKRITPTHSFASIPSKRLPPVPSATTQSLGTDLKGCGFADARINVSGDDILRPSDAKQWPGNIDQGGVIHRQEIVASTSHQHAVTGGNTGGQYTMSNQKKLGCLSLPHNPVQNCSNYTLKLGLNSYSDCNQALSSFEGISSDLNYGHVISSHGATHALHPGNQSLRSFDQSKRQERLNLKPMVVVSRSSKERVVSDEGSQNEPLECLTTDGSMELHPSTSALYLENSLAKTK